MSTTPLFQTRRENASRAFSMMQLLIAAAIVLVLVTVAVPVYSTLRQRAHKQVALERFKTLGGALANYASQNAGMLPTEDVDGSDTWDRIARPDAKDAWYNALPRLLGRKGAGDYSPTEFYTEDNLLFLPGANYPDKKKLLAPQFAIAFNTKLQRNDPATGEKQRTKMEQIANPARTVALLEQGCLNESKTMAVQTRKDYDGSPKGSAKSFVGRYDGKGVLLFLDGHVGLVSVTDVLTQTGDFPFPQGEVVWTRTPDENPNKDEFKKAEEKKSKK
jgi:prepilin-type processing-associated H-X9-DG protein